MYFHCVFYCKLTVQYNGNLYAVKFTVILRKILNSVGYFEDIKQDRPVF